MVLRSDEAANEAEIERDQRFRGNVKKGATAAINIASGVGGAAIASKIAPFFSKYIPIGLAIQGINKISPKLGEFLQKGQSMGLDVQEGLDFIKDKLSPQQEPKQEEQQQPEQSQQQTPKEDRNIIQQYSPNLFQYIQELIQNGSTPTEAAMKAQKNLDNKYKSMIKQIEKDHKTPWSNIVESIFGQAGKTQQQPSGQMGQMGQQGGPGQQALMQTLQMINQKLGI